MSSPSADGLRVAIIGAGYWGPNLIRNFSEAPGAEPVAVADLSDDRLRGVRKRYPSIRTTTDHREILGDPTIDAVVIATPISTHRPLVLEAFAAGKHVLVEKPLASASSASARCVEIGVAMATASTLGSAKISRWSVVVRIDG